MHVDIFNHLLTADKKRDGTTHVMGRAIRKNGLEEPSLSYEYIEINKNAFPDYIQALLDKHNDGHKNRPQRSATPSPNGLEPADFRASEKKRKRGHGLRVRKGPKPSSSS